MLVTQKLLKALCVCPPLYLRVLPPRCFEQGDQASRLTKLGSEMGSTERRLSVYLQTELLLKLSKLLCLVPWFFMLPHPKPQFFSAAAPRSLSSAVTRKTTLLKHLQVPGRFTFLFHHLSSTWELS